MGVCYLLVTSAAFNKTFGRTSMPTMLNEVDQVSDLSSDPRWLLVERITSSASFAKSVRLTTMLECIVRLALTNRFEDINEQYLGSTVFGRNLDYDSSIDSIVRSHASRLRHRLDRYFAIEGSNEELQLTIPRGGYIPVFESRVKSSQEPYAESLSQPLDREADIQRNISLTAPASALSSGEEPDATVTAEAQGRLIRILYGFLTVAVLLLLVAGGYILQQQRQAAAVQPRSAESHPLWRRLFNSHQKTLIVHGDSSLVILQSLSRRRVTLSSYINGDYIKDLPPSPLPEKLERDLGTRRYTSVVDLRIDNSIHQIPGI